MHSVSHGNAIREALQGVPLFTACSKRDLRIIARHMQVIEVPEGTVLMREGDEGDAFYVALRGSAVIQRGGADVATLEAGGYTGELAMIDPAPRSATVTTTSVMVLGVLDRRSFLAMLRDLPALSGKLMRTLAARLRQRDAEARRA